LKTNPGAASPQVAAAARQAYNQNDAHDEMEEHVPPCYGFSRHEIPGRLVKLD
jgi:hypothetical protein